MENKWKKENFTKGMDYIIYNILEDRIFDKTNYIILLKGIQTDEEIYKKCIETKKVAKELGKNIFITNELVNGYLVEIDETVINEYIKKEMTKPEFKDLSKTIEGMVKDANKHRDSERLKLATLIDNTFKNGKTELKIVIMNKSVNHLYMTEIINKTNRYVLKLNSFEIGLTDLNKVNEVLSKAKCFISNIKVESIMPEKKGVMVTLTLGER